jgi:Na+(H+)/acetate symporter ActP
MGVTEVALAGFTVALGFIAIWATRIRSSDPRRGHLWFGLSREENGRVGAVVGMVAIMVLSLLEPRWFMTYPIVTLSWILLLLFFGYRGWIRKSGER